MTLRRRRRICRLITIATGLLCVLPPRSSMAVEPPKSDTLQINPAIARVPTITDVELDHNGTLAGIVVDEGGVRQSNILVSVERPNQEVVQVVTEQDGRFEMPLLRGGMYHVHVAGAELTCRAWRNGTAPPAAQRQLLLVTRETVTRAQREFGAILHKDKVLIALILAGAIAIPIAIAAQSGDDAPSS